MPCMFYCFLVQFDRVVHVLKKKTIVLSGGPLGVGTYVPMSLWPYISLYTYVPMYLCPQSGFQNLSFFE